MFVIVIVRLSVSYFLAYMDKVNVSFDRTSSTSPISSYLHLIFSFIDTISTAVYLLTYLGLNWKVISTLSKGPIDRW